MNTRGGPPFWRLRIWLLSVANVNLCKTWTELDAFGSRIKLVKTTLTQAIRRLWNEFVQTGQEKENFN